MAEIMTGENKRVKSIEYYLPRLVEEGTLFVAKYRRKYVYTLSTKRENYTADMVHGIICTEILLRILRSTVGCEVVPERYFRYKKLGVIPEWAILFLTGAMLMLEYCTANNFKRTGLIRSKVKRYFKHLERIENHFDYWAIVLFVFDAPSYETKSFVEQYSPKDDAFYYVDLNSFMEVDGDQLDAPIYICGEDGKKYPLT